MVLVNKSVALHVKQNCNFQVFLCIRTNNMETSNYTICWSLWNGKITSLMWVSLIWSLNHANYDYILAYPNVLSYSLARQSINCLYFRAYARAIVLDLQRHFAFLNTSSASHIRPVWYHIYRSKINWRWWNNIIFYIFWYTCSLNIMLRILHVKLQTLCRIQIRNHFNI